MEKIFYIPSLVILYKGDAENFLSMVNLSKIASNLFKF